MSFQGLPFGGPFSLGLAMPFSEIVEIVLEHEGGEVHDPSDPGGHTKYGISQRSYPEEDIAALTRDDAIEIYRRDFWRPIKGAELPKSLQLAVFDGAVNHGVGQSIRLLQRAVGATVDGIIGPQTLGMAKAANQAQALSAYCAERGYLYGRLPTFGRFGRGWMRRLMDIHARSLRKIR